MVFGRWGSQDELLSSRAKVLSLLIVVRLRDWLDYG